jgi:hypothetical protein
MKHSHNRISFLDNKAKHISHTDIEDVQIATRNERIEFYVAGKYSTIVCFYVKGILRLNDEITKK